MDRVRSLEKAIKDNKRIIRESKSPNQRDLARQRIKLLKNKRYAIKAEIRGVRT